MTFKNYAGLAIALALSSAPWISAHATTYTSAPYGSTGVRSVTGEPIGETFVAPGGQLDSFLFYAAAFASPPSNYDIVISAWDGAKPVGASLYTSPIISYSGTGTPELRADNINVSLVSGTQYIAYLESVGAPVADTLPLLSDANPATDPLSGGIAVEYHGQWLSSNQEVLAYTAEFSSAVPEPDSYALFLAGLSLFGIVGRKRKPREAQQ